MSVKLTFKSVKINQLIKLLIEWWLTIIEDTEGENLFFKTLLWWSVFTLVEP